MESPTPEKIKFHEGRPMEPESQGRLDFINETRKQLENLSDFHLDQPGGREGLKVALDLIFSNIEKIEGAEEYDVIGIIKGRIRDTYTQLYGIRFKGDPQSPEARAFYSEIEEIMEIIEKRGGRFVEDMEIYKKFNEERKAA